VRVTARLRLSALSEPARRALAAVDGALGTADGWLVGGALRDALLGESAHELDVAVASGALALGRSLTDRLPGAAFVALDERRGVCRVVGDVQIDIADFRAGDLAGDLRGRDFTVNALAASVRALVRDGAAPVEDALGGLSDLDARIIRACAPTALRDDPLRTLRAVRLGIRPGWRVDPATEELIRAAGPDVARASAERVRDELGAILARPTAGAALRALDRLAVLGALLPESSAMRATPQPEPHRFDVWEHSIRAVEAADALSTRLDALEPWGAELTRHLGEPLGDGFRRLEILKLAALLHDVAKPETRTVERGRIRFIGHDVIGAERSRAIAERWRLSRRAVAVLGVLVAQHLRPMHLASAPEVTRRARYRFFRDLAGEARDLLLLSLVDAAAVRGDSPIAVWAGAGGGVVRDLMGALAEAAQAAASPPLLRGEDVMAVFDLPPGPAVGRLLARAREAQALGLARSRTEAIAFLRRVGVLDTSADGPIE
jgi:putative nucleotidyltransferase with HDIG domain